MGLKNKNINECKIMMQVHKEDISYFVWHINICEYIYNGKNILTMNASLNHIQIMVIIFVVAKLG